MKEKLNADLVFIVLSFAFFILLVFLFIITLSIRYRKRKKENDEMRVQFAETLLRSRLEIQEQTLLHISREIHDNLGQVASLIKINLNTIQLDEKEKAASKIDHSKELVKQMIADLKQLSTSLNSDKIAKTGLAGALKFESERLEKTGQFKSVFVQHDTLPFIENDSAIILYRMSQEIINNAVKHAEATVINIDFHHNGKNLVLIIADNGIGFDFKSKTENTQHTGNGLGNLFSRAKLIHAKIKYESVINKGTSVTINFPTT